MKKVLFFIFLLIIAFSFALEVNRYYSFSFDYSGNKLSLEGFDIINSEKILVNSFGLSSFRIYDFYGNILYYSFFSINNSGLVDYVDENGKIVAGGFEYIDELSTIVNVPYYKNAKEIRFYNESLNEIFVYDVSSYSKTIPVNSVIVNGKFEIEENPALEFINKSEEEKDEKVVISVEKNSFERVVSKYWWMLGVVLGLLVILFIKLFKESSKK